MISNSLSVKPSEGLNINNNIDDDQKVVGYLLFKKVLIQGANAISSPLTYGFPSVTGFLGAFHAMSRKLDGLSEDLEGVSLGGVLLACHECTPHIYRDKPYSEYTFNLTRNPLKSNGATASIIEEGKCRLVMSFVVEIVADTSLSESETDSLISHTSKMIWTHRMAGGSVHGLSKVDPVQYFDYEDVDQIVPHLLPAFVLIEAKKEFSEVIDEVKAENPEATALDALIEVSSLRHEPRAASNGSTKWATTSRKTGRGWLVPMPLGFQAISELYSPGVMQNSRSPDNPNQYVEAVYGLGKWVYPQRLGGIDSERDITEAFWRYDNNTDNHLYLVTQETN